MYLKNGFCYISSLILLGLLFLSPKTPVYAAAPTITSSLSSVDLDSSFTISATMSGLTSNAIYRLRIVFAPVGTSNYFGSTWNETSWYNGTPSPINYGSFLTITTNGNGAWWGDIQGKVEADDPNFTTGGGTYDLKVGRYTQTGSSATWSNILAMQLSLPPSPTPSPTTAPSATNTPTPTKTPTPTPSPKPSPSNTPTQKPTVTSVLPTDVLGEATDSGEEVVKSPDKETKVLGEQTNNMPKILIGLGIIFLVSCAILAFRKLKIKN